MPETALREIMRVLGRLEAGQEQMREDFTDEKKHTREHRERQYGQLKKLEETVSIVGQTAAQARDKAGTVEKVVIEDVKPVTDDVKRMRALGLGLLGIIGLLAGTLGAAFAEPIKQAVGWLRSALGGGA